MPRGRKRKDSNYDSHVVTDNGGYSTPITDNGGDGWSDDGQLMSSKEFVGADGSEDHWRDVHWVYNNLWVKEVEAKDAPSAGAWFWLMDCRRSADARAKFRDYYMKLAPSRKELDERARRGDGGEEVLELLKVVEKALR